MWGMGAPPGLTPEQQQQMLLAQQQYAASQPPPQQQQQQLEEEEPARETLPVVCDSTMNLEQKLFQNMLDDYYAKELVANCPTFEDLCEEARQEGTHTNAWGGMRGDYKRAEVMIIGRKKSDTFEHDKQAPAKLWCILFRMFQMRLSSEQLEYLLKDNSKVCLKALGILYVRLTQKHEDYVHWLAGPLKDTDTVVQVAPMGLRQGTSTTVDKFTRNVILEVKYLGTRFPRIPELKLRKIKQQLAEMDGTAVEVSEQEKDGAGAAKRPFSRKEANELHRGGRGMGRVTPPPAEEEEKGGDGDKPKPDAPAPRRRRLGRLAMEMEDMQRRGGGQADAARREAEREKEAERKRERERRLYSFEERVRDRNNERDDNRRVRDRDNRDRDRDDRGRRDRDPLDRDRSTPPRSDAMRRADNARASLRKLL